MKSRRDTIAALARRHHFVSTSLVTDQGFCAGPYCGRDQGTTVETHAAHVADVIDLALDQDEPRLPEWVTATHQHADGRLCWLSGSTGSWYTERPFSATRPICHDEHHQDEPRQDEGGDREALARVLYDDAGFHAADHWGVESGITRGRYESAADAVLAWMRTEGFRRHPEEPEGRGSFWTPSEWADWSDSLAELLPEESDGDAAQEALIERALADLVGRAGEEPEGTAATRRRRLLAEVICYEKGHRRGTPAEARGDYCLNCWSRALVHVGSFAAEVSDD